MYFCMRPHAVQTQVLLTFLILKTTTPLGLGGVVLIHRSVKVVKLHPQNSGTAQIEGAQLTWWVFVSDQSHRKVYVCMT